LFQTRVDIEQTARRSELLSKHRKVLSGKKIIIIIIIINDFKSRRSGYGLRWNVRFVSDSLLCERFYVRRSRADQDETFRDEKTKIDPSRRSTTIGLVFERNKDNLMSTASIIGTTKLSLRDEFHALKRSHAQPRQSKAHMRGNWPKTNDHNVVYRAYGHFWMATWPLVSRTATMESDIQKKNHKTQTTTPWTSVSQTFPPADHLEIGKMLTDPLTKIKTIMNSNNCIALFTWRNVRIFMIIQNYWQRMICIISEKMFSTTGGVVSSTLDRLY